MIRIGTGIFCACALCLPIIAAQKRLNFFDTDKNVICMNYGKVELVDLLAAHKNELFDSHFHNAIGAKLSA
jgi:hypothetical protein